MATASQMTGRSRTTAPTARQGAAVDWQAVGAALGKTGQVTPGDVYRVGLARTDLKVAVEGVPIQPALALGSYAAFKATRDQAMMMSDLVLLDQDVEPVLAGLFADGLSLDALLYQGRAIDDGLLKHVVAVHWNHINLTGDDTWRQNKRVEKGGFRPLRPAARAWRTLNSPFVNRPQYGADRERDAPRCPRTRCRAASTSRVLLSARRTARGCRGSRGAARPVRAGRLHSALATAPDAVRPGAAPRALGAGPFPRR